MAVLRVCKKAFEDATILSIEPETASEREDGKNVILLHIYMRLSEEEEIFKFYIKKLLRNWFSFIFRVLN